MADPSESPTSIPTVSAGRQMSVVRGVAYGVLFGVFGFCIPFAVHGIVLLLRLAFTHMDAIDRADALAELVMNAAHSGSAISMLFAMSAVANFTPRRGIGFLRSFLVTIGFTIGICFVMGLVYAVFEPFLFIPKGGSPPPFFYVFIAIYFTALAVGTIAFTRWQIRRSERLC